MRLLFKLNCYIFFIFKFFLNTSHYIISKLCIMFTMDKKEGAFFVMADDLLGGLYAAITMVILKIIIAIIAT